jgi:hypothetical protein
MIAGSSQNMTGNGDETRARSLVDLFTTIASGQDPQLSQKRQDLGSLLSLFSSARRRVGLSADEVLIFLAIGYLSASVSKSVVATCPTSYSEISSLLGIPKETVRRKTIRLVDLEFVRSTPKGVLVGKIDKWDGIFRF